MVRPPVGRRWGRKKIMGQAWIGCGGRSLRRVMAYTCWILCRVSDTFEVVGVVNNGDIAKGRSVLRVTVLAHII